MRILICPDKFKGSLTAPQVCDAVEEGISKKFPQAQIVKLPLADGGEGTAVILTRFFKGETVKVKVHGPLFVEVEAEYGLAGDLAFIEMAKASGLQLIMNEKRNPLETTTLGTGELIADAVRRGCSKIILGIGGSATNDAGIGMASALGYRFLDERGILLSPVGKNLINIRKIETPGSRLNVTALCDVTNPLYGPNGAAYIYGPQKGADSEAVAVLDRGLENFEKVVRETFQKSADFPGAGAGGGIAGGASIFFNLTVRSGIDFIMETLKVSEEIRKADLVITGEGKIDRQTLSGKVVGHVVQQATALGKRVIAICGVSEIHAVDLGAEAIISLVDNFTKSDDAISNANSLIAQKMAIFTP